MVLAQFRAEDGTLTSSLYSAVVTSVTKTKVGVRFLDDQKEQSHKRDSICPFGQRQH
jgi:hypothetical protein